ncbi:thiamine transport system permease protein [Rhodovulum imhoffii]|uniref:Thiamine transport system permease protein n=1 Tax=Rhodovulum imhoffii TaxID=365340 RepID=A0A2T5BPD5_9RHOB|nr:thiamine/thiamine pyrophosphate ABC transporter permease ThiP [Rhodovulum imhoffii]MBK5932645.1 thiamine/thiamine pyrophosphate ABC transporter permease ThiP [Rhodovulum imhoffii]PTN00900.1 thiamine transport system permease protein [Rhodovulum imhoffii]
MAHRAQPVAAGLAAAALILALAFGTLGAVAWRAEGFGALAPADWAAIRFTVLQAVLSATLSCILAIPVARALARRNFWGRGLLITLLGAPFLLPVIVAVLGLLAVFGRSGLISEGLTWAGLDPLDIYGLPGVVLAHVFLNLPLATRLVLQGWLSIPAERFRLAAALGFTPADTRRVLEAPMLRTVLPGIFAVILLICMTSFAVVLTLGGGPKAATVELAIYQAFRLEFDLARAAKLALVQFALCGAAAGLAFAVSSPAGMGAGLDRAVARWDSATRHARLADGFWLGGATLFLLVPLGMIVAQGLAGLTDLPASIYAAAGRSLVTALGSAALTVGLALPMAMAACRLGPRLGGAVQAAGTVSIAASPLVMGTGLFILLFPVADPVALALPVTALVNAAMALPFALRALATAVAEIEAGYGKLADSLGMSGGIRLRLVLLPRLRRPLGFSLGLSAALSMGDLGVIALFADSSQATLPLQLYRLMAAYRMEAAAGAALLLLCLSLGVFWIFDRGGRAYAEA